MDGFKFSPIGIVKSQMTHKLESPTQSTKALGESAVLELEEAYNFEQALEGLEEFERIWVIYQFHLNDHWNPKVQVPRLEDKKLGVFATRSPYRPNPIGISCVKLEKIEGRRLFIRESDMLDQSLILDIKPYVDYSDSFNTAYPDWLGEAEEDEYKVICPEYVVKQISYLQRKTNLNFTQFIDTQLKFKPLETKRKRIEVLSENDDSILAQIAFRTWRVVYELDKANKTVLISKIKSGYNREELSDKTNDPYMDKKIHNQFTSNFS